MCAAIIPRPSYLPVESSKTTSSQALQLRSRHLQLENSQLTQPGGLSRGGLLPVCAQSRGDDIYLSRAVMRGSGQLCNWAGLGDVRHLRHDVSSCSALPAPREVMGNRTRRSHVQGAQCKQPAAAAARQRNQMHVKVRKHHTEAASFFCLVTECSLRGQMSLSFGRRGVGRDTLKSCSPMSAWHSRGNGQGEKVHRGRLTQKGLRLLGCRSAVGATNDTCPSEASAHGFSRADGSRPARCPLFERIRTMLNLLGSLKICHTTPSNPSLPSMCHLKL